MRYRGILVGSIFCASLIIAAVIVRDGLLAIATEVRQKQVPKLPEQIHLMAGDSKLNINVAKMSLRGSGNPSELNISIDNLQVEPATRP